MNWVSADDGENCISHSGMQSFFSTCLMMALLKKKKKLRSWLAGWGWRWVGVKMAHYNLQEQHATWWWVHVCAGVTTPQTWRPVSDRKANWQAQTHRSGESMGPARAYLLPMMKPNTMKTRMMVPATATTAMMMTGFCSLETVAAEETETRSEPTSRRKLQSAVQTVMKSQWAAWRLITPPLIPSLRHHRKKGCFYFGAHTHTHTQLTVSESGLNSPRRQRRFPPSQTKTHSGWSCDCSEQHPASTEEAWDQLNPHRRETWQLSIRRPAWSFTTMEEETTSELMLDTSECRKTRNLSQDEVESAKTQSVFAFIGW